MTRDGVIAWVFAFRRKGNVDSRRHRDRGDLKLVLISFLNQRDHNLFGCAGIGRALKNDELSFVQIRREWMRRYR